MNVIHDHVSVLKRTETFALFHYGHNALRHRTPQRRNTALPLSIVATHCGRNCGRSLRPRNAWPQ